MKDYKIELTLNGSMTQVPDSQKIFGALLYMFSEEYGAENATMLAKSILEKKIHIALSNILPSGYLPMPLDYLVERIAEKKQKNNLSINLKKARQGIKERSYIRCEDLNDIIVDPMKSIDIFPYISQKSAQQLRASIESVYHDIPELETQLYSVPSITLSEISKETSKMVTTYCFYLQIDESDSGIDFMKMIDLAVEESRIIILGKRATQGLNIFRFTNKIEQNFKFSKSNLFLNVGMLLPDSIDFEKSYIKLFTSERRPFEMIGGWDKQSCSNYISFIAEGSMIRVADEIVSAGKSIESYLHKDRDIVFGNAYLYPLKKFEGRVGYEKNHI